MHVLYCTPKSFFILRIAYSVYEVERLLSKCVDKSDVRVTYDIGCTLSAHLKVNRKCCIVLAQ